jgi:hypothetical protein
VIGCDISAMARIAWIMASDKAGNGYLCRCPVPTHGKGRGDKNPSLSICNGNDRKLVVHCHAGCAPSDVLKALGASEDEGGRQSGTHKESGFLNNGAKPNSFDSEEKLKPPHVPWEWIVDETRELEKSPTWDDPEAYIRVVSRSYRRDFWGLQPVRVEVWSEKGTVRGVLAPVLDQYGVGFRVMHGFSGATTLREVAQDNDDRPLIILYVGDYVPAKDLCNVCSRGSHWHRPLPIAVPRRLALSVAGPTTTR